jgi:hypothetical protein
MNRIVSRKLFVGIFVMAALIAVLLGVVAVQAQGPRPQAPQAALGPGFSYQGELKKNGSPVIDNSCVMTSTLWDSQSNLSGQIGGNQIINPVAVNGGLFTVQLNTGNQFGADAFTGSDRWLQTVVKCTADGVPIMLSRQQLSATPYALSLRPGALISGTVPPNGSVFSVINPSSTFSGRASIDGKQGNGISLTVRQAGVWGDADNGSGVVGTSAGNGYGVEAYSSGNIGVHGEGYPAGMQGQSNGFGVWGIGTVAGVYGSSDNNDGLSGFSGSGNGVFGTSGVTGVVGISTGSGGSVAGVYGQTAHGSGLTLLPSAGVWGDTSTGDGVAGISNSGAGVYGAATTSNGAAVWADGSGPTGTALKISNGGIKVVGAGIGSTTPVFIHKALAATIPVAHTQQTIIDSPLTNGNPNVMLIVTPNYNPGGVFAAFDNTPVGVFYTGSTGDSFANKWGIFNMDLSPMTVNSTFNVLVVKP